MDLLELSEVLKSSAFTAPGRSAAWLARLAWDQEVADSNSAAPTPLQGCHETHSGSRKATCVRASLVLSKPGEGTSTGQGTKEGGLGLVSRIQEDTGLCSVWPESPSDSRLSPSGSIG